MPDQVEAHTTEADLTAAPETSETITSDPQPEPVPTPEPAPIVPKHVTMPKWLASTTGAAMLFLILGILAMGGALAFQSWRSSEREAHRDRIQEMLVTNMVRMNEQQVIRNIIHEKLEGKVTIDQESRICFEIFEGCRRNGIPYEMFLGLIDQESTWNPNAVSSVGAMGLAQVMLDTAVIIAQRHGEVITLARLKDPVVNVAYGIEVLVSKHAAAVMLSKSSQGDYTMALNNYVGGDPKYILQVMQKAVAYKKRLDSPMAEASIVLNASKN